MELRLATDAEKSSRDVVTHVAWGQKLSIEQYLDREERLRAHPWSREVMRTWLLSEGSELLASCETFAMQARFRHSGREVRGAIEGVASVFVEERLRGQKLASKLFEALVARFRGESALGSILYSDVGEELYARSGYVTRPAISRIFSGEAGDPAGACDRVLDEEPESIRKALDGAPEPDDALLLWPSATQLDWHFERERIYAELLDRPRPKAHGAIAGNARAVWAADLKNGSLRILWLAARRTDEALALIQSARRAAHAAGLAKVELWECAWPFELADDAGEGSLVRRSESLPMICPLVAGLDPRDWGQTSRATWI